MFYIFILLCVSSEVFTLEDSDSHATTSHFHPHSFSIKRCHHDNDCTKENTFYFVNQTKHHCFCPICEQHVDHKRCYCDDQVDRHNPIYKGRQDFRAFGYTRTFNEAINICDERGMRLVRVDNETTLRSLQYFIVNHKSTDDQWQNLDGYFLDKKRDHNHHIVTHDGENSTFLHWSSDHKHSNDGSRCIKLWDDCELLMGDIHCGGEKHDRYGVICEEVHHRKYCFFKTDCLNELSNCSSEGKHCVDGDCMCKEPVKITTTSIPDVCDPSPCKNGQCLASLGGQFICICKPGYTGTLCDMDVCDPSACKNGQCLASLGGQFICICKPGYTGTLCDMDINECSSLPCLNGGICTNRINGYTCTCAPGFNGSNCQTDVNECFSSPCLNGGTCIDGVYRYTCACVFGFTDRNCQTAITTPAATKPKPTSALPNLTSIFIIITAPPPARKCYQCGDQAGGYPCTPTEIHDVHFLTPSVCNSGEYCMTDVIHTNGVSAIYKRCVDQHTCVRQWLQQSSDKDYCISYGHSQSSGTFSCHFCCTEDGCNSGILPANDTIYSRI